MVLMQKNPHQPPPQNPNPYEYLTVELEAQAKSPILYDEINAPSEGSCAFFLLHLHCLSFILA